MPAAEVFRDIGLPFELTIVSARRTVERMIEDARTAHTRGLRAIIAGAGGAAHLPGMMASKTALPVIGVPVQTRALAGVDSLYSIVQMPRGYPVATMAIGPTGAANAALFAASILALADPPVGERLDIIVPGRALRELARLIGDESEPVRLAITPNRSQLLVRVGETEFVSRLIEGVFPDFRQIIPREFSTRLELGREAMLNAVRRASYFARDNNDVVRLVGGPARTTATGGWRE